MLLLLWLTLYCALCQDASCSVASTPSLHPEMDQSLGERMKMMEEKLTRLESYAGELEQQLEHQQSANDETAEALKRNVTNLELQLAKKIRQERLRENMLKQLVSRMDHQQREIDALSENIDQLKASNDDKVQSENSTDVNTLHVGRIAKRHMARQVNQTPPHNAFSVYLTSSLTGLAPDHIIRFTGITHNEGSGYNQYTGIFTAPASGVYLFSFFIEDVVNHRLRVKLVVNDSRKSSGVAYPYTAGRNTQGGNLVVLRLMAGDSVWIAIDETNDSIAGSATYKTTTFTGMFLYA